MSSFTAYIYVYIHRPMSSFTFLIYFVLVTHFFSFVLVTQFFSFVCTRDSIFSSQVLLRRTVGHNTPTHVLLHARSILRWTSHQCVTLFLTHLWPAIGQLSFFSFFSLYFFSKIIFFGGNVLWTCVASFIFLFLTVEHGSCEMGIKLVCAGSAVVHKVHISLRLY